MGMEFELRISDLPIRVCTGQPMTEKDLLRFCSRNDALRIEREPNGELSIMSPAGSESSKANARITAQMLRWADEDGRGTTFDSNAGFQLRSGAMRSPDASWVSWTQWNGLTREQKRGFAPICPDFVIELRSPSDRLADLQAKMHEWVANGAELAWLVDPERQAVEVYRPGVATPHVLEGVSSVAGEGQVAGFVLDLAPIWNPA